MQRPVGATVRITFYVISSTGHPNRWFSAEDVLDKLKIVMKKPKHSIKIRALLKTKKHHGRSMPVVFGNKGKMRGWLKKHHNVQGRFWFDMKNDRFRFKLNEISTLRTLIK